MDLRASLKLRRALSQLSWMSCSPAGLQYHQCLDGLNAHRRLAGLCARFCHVSCFPSSLAIVCYVKLLSVCVSSMFKAVVLFLVCICCLNSCGCDVELFYVMPRLAFLLHGILIAGLRRLYSTDKVDKRDKKRKQAAIDDIEQAEQGNNPAPDADSSLTTPQESLYTKTQRARSTKATAWAFDPITPALITMCLYVSQPVEFLFYNLFKMQKDKVWLSSDICDWPVVNFANLACSPAVKTISQLCDVLLGEIISIFALLDGQVPSDQL
jgi:hypothetical protein